MKKSGQLGIEVPLKDYFEAQEGELNMYYGRIGSGKTYGATADIIDELNKGKLVYATWPIKLDDFDDREKGFMIIRNLFFWKKPFFKVNCPQNFHFINAETGEVDGIPTFNPNRPSEYIEYLNKLNHCSLYIDEAWRVIDSYQKTNFSMDSRNLILVTRHKYRTINLIAQRPTSIQVTARANINRFYKFEKVSSWPWVRFKRSEYQDMINETVNEELEPISEKRYWLSKDIADRYNSYFYGELKPLHEVEYKVFKLTLKEKWIAFLNLFRKKEKKEEQITTHSPF